MQLTLTFSTKELCLPLAHRHCIQSMIYHTLSSNPVFSQALHDGEGKDPSRVYKLFTFGQLEGAYRIVNKQIVFFDTVSLRIRSVHEELLWILLKELIPGSRLRLLQTEVTVSGCVLENRVITKPEIQIRTVSPIVAYVTNPDKSTRFFSPKEQEFYSLSIENARRKWVQAGNPENAFSLSITPISGTLFRKQVTRFKTTIINAWDGQFLLSGNPAVLDFLYNTGLGAKSSQGFGMFDVCLRILSCPEKED